MWDFTVCAHIKAATQTASKCGFQLSSLSSSNSEQHFFMLSTFFLLMIALWKTNNGRIMYEVWWSLNFPSSSTRAMFALIKRSSDVKKQFGRMKERRVSRQIIAQLSLCLEAKEPKRSSTLIELSAESSLRRSKKRADVVISCAFHS